MLRRSWILWLVLFGGLGLAFQLLVPTDAFWITDGGNKFIQVQSLGRSGSLFDLEYVGVEEDPGLRFFPRAGHHFVVDDGKARSFYPPWFSLVSWLPYRALGSLGLFVLPALAAGACCLITAGLVSRILPGAESWRRWVAPLVLVATPIGFYGLTFWEMTLAAALCGAGFLSLVAAQNSDQPNSDQPNSDQPNSDEQDSDEQDSDQQNSRQQARCFLTAGFLFGLAGVFREEGLVALAAAGVALLLLRTPLRLPLWMAAGAALPTLGALVFNLLGTGRFLGYHVVGYATGVGSSFSFNPLEEVADAWFYLWTYHPEPRVVAFSAIPLGILAVLAAWRQRARGASPVALGAVLTVSALSVLGLSILHLSDPQSVIATTARQSLLPGLPLGMLVFALVWRDQSRPVKLLGLSSLIYAVSIIGLLHRGDVGIIFGPRHFLPMVPVILALALCAARAIGRELAPRRWLLTAIVGMLLTASLFNNARGVLDLALKRFVTARIVNGVKSLDVLNVATDVFWVPEELSALFYQLHFRELRSDADLPALAETLAAAGEEEMVLLLSPFFRVLSPAAVRRAERLARHRLILADARGRLSHLGLMALVLPTDPDRWIAP